MRNSSYFKIWRILYFSYILFSKFKDICFNLLYLFHAKKQFFIIFRNRLWVIIAYLTFWTFSNRVIFFHRHKILLSFILFKIHRFLINFRQIFFWLWWWVSQASKNIAIYPLVLTSSWPIFWLNWCECFLIGCSSHFWSSFWASIFFCFILKVKS